MGSKTIKTHVLIVGGGIVGAGLLRDLALHGVETQLIERSEFGSETSSKSSKMLHGGIRYLETLDFLLVKEALHEKNLWLKIAPHLAKEKKFYLPNYKNSKFPLWMLFFGIKLYDLLSGLQNKNGFIISKEKTLSEVKGLGAKGLLGSAVYFDSIVDDTKLTIENIHAATLEPKAFASEHTELIKIKKIKDSYIASVLNRKTNEEYEIEAKEVIFATGPFTDFLMKKLDLPWENKMALSKGSHLWIKKEALPLKEDAVVIQTKDDRIIFVIPERDKILVGTTEIEVKSTDELFNTEASEDEINYLLYWLNNYFPNEHVKKENILSSFSGIRPLVKEYGQKNRGKTSRKHLLYHIYPDMHVLIGGKLTTFRTMGQELTKLITGRLNIKYDKNLTKKPLKK